MIRLNSVVMVVMVVLNVSGWEWSTTARGTGAQMRPVWAASWLHWSRPRFTDTTGPAAANRSSTDTYSKSLILISAVGVLEMMRMKLHADIISLDGKKLD